MNALWFGEKGKLYFFYCISFWIFKKKLTGCRIKVKRALNFSQFARNLFGKCHMTKNMASKRCRSRFLYWADAILAVCRSVGAMDVGCAENAHNQSVWYIQRQTHLSKPLTGWSNFQGQETNSFDETFVEFPSCWDLNDTTVKSETAIEIN